MLALLFVPAVPAQSSSDEVLLVIDGHETTVSTFHRYWEKSEYYPDPEMISDFLENFIDFRLKIAHALREGIHLETSFINKLENFRMKLSDKYLSDNEIAEELVKEAYERLQYEINASHILIALDPDHSPDDTLYALDKAVQIRESLINGEPFDLMAKAVSDDPSAKINSGNLGFFTALQMPYEFENAVYDAEPGEIGMPVRSHFGYHIIRVNEKIKSRGELKVAHIMIGFNYYDEPEAKEMAEKIHRDLKDGNDFRALAMSNSTDYNSALKGGVVDWFGSGSFVFEFENAAFALKAPGDISDPVPTPYGWHIIKLLDQREIPPYAEIRERLLDKMRRSCNSRSGLIRDARVERLKTEWDFSENPGALEMIYRLADNSIFEGKWKAPGHLPLDDVIFSIAGSNIIQRDFAEFVSQNAYPRQPWPLRDYITLLYNTYVRTSLIRLEEKNLENKYPELGYMMDEFRDGMLLQEITDREIWSRAPSDTGGLLEFHRNNLENYMWGKRISATIFITSDRATARRIAWRTRISNFFGGSDDDWIIKPMNSEKDSLIQGLFSKGDKDLTDRVTWEEGISDIFLVNNHYKLVVINEVLDPEPKTFDEAKEQVIVDYHDHLERTWLENLRAIFNVTVNRNVLSDFY